MRLEYEGLSRSEAAAADPAAYAMSRYAYYVCSRCGKAYYGGEAQCEAEGAAAGGQFDPSELVCGGCSDVSRAQVENHHYRLHHQASLSTHFNRCARSTEQTTLEYKCRYCCSVAVFFCFGTTHFCSACHDDFQRVANLPKTELPHCPVGPK